MKGKYKDCMNCVLSGPFKASFCTYLNLYHYFLKAITQPKHRQKTKSRWKLTKLASATMEQNEMQKNKRKGDGKNVKIN